MSGRVQHQQPRPIVHVCMAVCGDTFARMAAATLRSVHHSAVRFGYPAHVHLMHDGAEELLRLRHVWRSAELHHISPLRLSWVLVNGSKPELRLFRRCAAARLHIPAIFDAAAFDDADGVALYMDTDAYVVGDLTQLVAHASR